MAEKGTSPSTPRRAKSTPELVNMGTPISFTNRLVVLPTKSTTGPLCQPRARRKVSSLASSLHTTLSYWVPLKSAKYVSELVTHGMYRVSSAGPETWRSKTISKLREVMA